MWLVLAAVAVAGALVTAYLMARPLIADRVRAAAQARGLSADWDAFSLQLPARVAFRGLLLRSIARGDTVCAAESLAVSLDLGSLLTGQPRVDALRLARARFVRNARRQPRDVAPPPPPEPPREHDDRPASPRVVRAARSLVETLLLPAREMPHITLHDVAIDGLEESAPEATGRRGARAAKRAQPVETVARNAHIRWLEMKPANGGIELRAAGSVDLDEHVPFEVNMGYDRDDHLTGALRIDIPDHANHRPEPLDVSIDGHVEQDRGAGVVRIAEPATVNLGGLPFSVTGSTSLRGPAVSLRLAADSLSERRIRQSMPRAALGPLAQVAVTGTWDYRLAFDLDLDKLGDVDFRADVIPHGLALDSTRTTLRIRGLGEPFVAEIHLPKDRIVTRALWSANPHFRSIDQIDSLLIKSVVTNEVGSSRVDLQACKLEYSIVSPK